VDSAAVSIEQSGNALQVEVTDNGCGFNMSDLDHGGSRFGLFSIRERLAHIGGQFEIESEPGSGTHCKIVCPLSFEEESSR
jgi:signal transduction histidine kinase